MPSLFWAAYPVSPGSLGPLAKSSPMNNQTRGGVGLSIHVLPEQRAYGILWQVQHNLLFYLTRRYILNWMPSLQVCKFASIFARWP